VFIERLWRSVKYENIYLRAYEDGTQLRRGLTEYFDFTTLGALTKRWTTRPGRCLLRPDRVQARGMIGVNAARSRSFCRFASDCVAWERLTKRQSKR